VGLACVTEDDEVMLVTEAGKILRTGVADVRIIGRATQGVRMIEIDEGDRVVSLARFAGRDDSDESDQGEEPGGAPAEERSEQD
jgi:DNA gyrase subunit A